MNESTLAYRQFIPSTLGIPRYTFLHLITVKGCVTCEAKKEAFVYLSLGSVQVEPSKIIQEYDAAYKHAMDGLNVSHRL